MADKACGFSTSLFAVHCTLDGNVDRPSATDKTLTVASINGNPVIVGLNAYIKPES
jgi:hypothetical protein